MNKPDVFLQPWKLDRDLRDWDVYCTVSERIIISSGQCGRLVNVIWAEEITVSPVEI
jgi:hypothetical protein